jgi:tetratricopeptide (TPR) repeat protein
MPNRYQASLRHALHYISVLRGAERSYLESAESAEHGLRIFDMERPHIEVGQAWAVAHATARKEAACLCSEFGEAGVYCLAVRQYPTDSIQWLEAALNAARQINDRPAEIAHLGNLGDRRRVLCDFPGAMICFEQQLAKARASGNLLNEGNAWGGLANCYLELGNTRRALDCYERRLKLARASHDRRGESNALGGIGNCWLDLGDVAKAIEYLQWKRTIVVENKDWKGEANTLGSLGNAYNQAGEIIMAIECYRRVVELSGRFGDRLTEATVLTNMGVAYARLEEFERGMRLLSESLTIARKIGHLATEATCLWNMALLSSEIGDLETAIQHGERALEIREQIHDSNVLKTRNMLRLWRETKGQNSTHSS